MRQITKFKETEIEKIPEDWEEKELSSLGKVVTGKTPPTANEENFGKEYPFITPRDMKDQKHVKTTERYLSEKGKNAVKNCLVAGSTICVSCIGSDMGKVVMTTQPSVTNQQLNSIVSKNVNPDFVYYAVEGITDQMRDSAFHSTAVPILNKSSFARFKILIPKDRKETDKIAKILSDLDSKIELNNQMNKTLESVGQALFKRWFVDFEFPNEKGKPYKSSGGEMIDSELGEIPKEWEAKTLGELTDFKNGVNYNRDTCGDSEYRIVNVRDIVSSSFVTKQMLDKIRIDSKKATAYLVKKNSILIIRSASPGEIGFVMNAFDDIIYSGFIIKAELSNEKLKYYIIQLLQSKKKELLNLSDGTTLKNINQVSLNGFKLLLPSNGIIEKYNQIVHSIYVRIFKNKEQSEFLSNMRDSLLPRLMSGRIRVK